ncbi:helix-turn-helix domain-containing protein (plasmid) [Bacillus mycoides]|nr:helix-turn-helix domain-containing protein [Bacillus mycoides]
MGKIKKTYDVFFKKKAVDLYLKEGMTYKKVAKKLGIDHKMVMRWVRYFKAEGIKGLEEKRGKSNKKRIKNSKESLDTVENKIKRLEAENEMLKKLLKM